MHVLFNIYEHLIPTGNDISFKIIIPNSDINMKRNILVSCYWALCFSDFHDRRFQRVVQSLPVLPVHTLSVPVVTIPSVQVAILTWIVPPASFSPISTVPQLKWLAALSFSLSYVEKGIPLLQIPHVFSKVLPININAFDTFVELLLWRMKKITISELSASQKA